MSSEDEQYLKTEEINDPFYKRSKELKAEIKRRKSVFHKNKVSILLSSEDY